jgi:phosphomannomutase/phosphoglucomutase
LATIARKYGVKPISGLILLLGLIYLFLAFNYLQSREQQAQASAQQSVHAHSFQLIQARIQQAVASQRQLLSVLAASPSLVANVSMGDEVAIRQWQEEIQQTLPKGSQLCVLMTLPNARNDATCLPLSFATLTTLRQFNDQTMTDLAVMQPSSDEAFVLLAHQVTSDSGVSNAALTMTLPISWLNEQLSGGSDGGLIAITQGQDKSVSLAFDGDRAFQQYNPAFVKPVPNTLWKVAYWPSTKVAGNTWMWLAVAVLIYLLMWWMTRAWLSHVFEVDAQVLKGQLQDLEDSKLKSRYPIMSATLKSVSQRINELVLPSVEPPIYVAAEPVPSSIEVDEMDEDVTEEAEGIVEQAISQAADNPIQVEESPIEKIEPVEPIVLEMPTPSSEVILEFDSGDRSVPDEAIFRKYDIRGKVGEQLNAEVMELLGKAVASEVIDQGFTKLVLGRDGRLTSEKFADAFCKGALTTGCDVIDLGLVPTPLMYFGCEHLDTQTGAMITGSHNPIDCNGLKVVIGGHALLGEEVKALYQRIKDKRFHSGHGQLATDNVSAAYIERVREDVQLSRAMRIVIDSGNGAAGPVAGELFKAMGCEVIELFGEVDGAFPNHHPDPGQPENLADLIAAVQQNEAEIGLAFDGDGDRLGVVDMSGNIIWPDKLLILMSQHLLAQEPGATIVYDVKCTNVLETVISRAGGRAIMTGSGHSVIKDKMHKEDAMLGGEMTGHFFYRDRWYGFDDALYSGARLLELLAADPLERSPSEVFDALPKRVGTPEIIIDMAEGESQPFIEQLIKQAKFDDGRSTTVDGLRVDFKDGWGLVRASNTVPGLTLRFEANSDETLSMIKQQFVEQMLQVKPSLTLFI